MQIIIRCLPWFLSLTAAFAAPAEQRALPIEDLDRYLTAWAQMERFTGNALIANDGKVVFRKSYGMANLEHDVPNRPETVFRIGSITKSFTALAVLQLGERGLLKVEDPLSKYLPETPSAWGVVTLHHLLTHTSGVPDISKTPAYKEYDDPLRIDKALKAMESAPLQFEPGSRFTYSNTGYMLLGRVIEKLSGRRYAEYITENILAPAGMTHSGLDVDGPVVKHRASGYVVQDGKLANAIRDNMMGPFSGGGLYSTADDMLRFDQALYTEKLVKRATLDRAFRPHVRAVFPPPFGDPNAFYGYGWVVSNIAGHKSSAHGGWVNGFVSDFTRYPDDGVVLIVLGNIEGPQMPVITQNLNKILWGAAYTLPKKRQTVKLDTAVLRPLAGKYEMAPGVALLVILENDGRMSVGVAGQGRNFELLPESESNFFVADLPTTLTFERDAAGKVTAALLDMDGQKVRARRLE